MVILEQFYSGSPKQQFSIRDDFEVSQKRYFRGKMQTSWSNVGLHVRPEYHYRTNTLNDMPNPPSKFSPCQPGSCVEGTDYKSAMYSAGYYHTINGQPWSDSSTSQGYSCDITHKTSQYSPYRYSLSNHAEGASIRNSTRESTNVLKTWLKEHDKNPYPSKGEKIMLAIVTKMSLTQISTWFANARRRLKKENKMTWAPKNRSGESFEANKWEDRDFVENIDKTSDLDTSDCKDKKVKDAVVDNKNSDMLYAAGVNPEVATETQGTLSSFHSITKNNWTAHDLSEIGHDMNGAEFGSYSSNFKPYDLIEHRSETILPQTSMMTELPIDPVPVLDAYAQTSFNQKSFSQQQNASCSMYKNLSPVTDCANRALSMPEENHVMRSQNYLYHSCYDVHQSNNRVICDALEGDAKTHQLPNQIHCLLPSYHPTMASNSQLSKTPPHLNMSDSTCDYYNPSNFHVQLNSVGSHARDEGHISPTEANLNPLSHSNIPKPLFPAMIPSAPACESNIYFPQQISRLY